MDFWNEQADQLEQALMANSKALVRHFLETASPELVSRVAGDAFTAAGDNTKASVIATLALRLRTPTGVAA